MALEQLQTLNEEGDPPKSRLTDASAAYQIWGTLRQADYNSSIQRARVDAMYDNEPPYSQAQLEQTGQSFRTNVNFGWGEMLLETAMSGYVDLLNSTETFFECPTVYGEASERREWEKIIAEEVTATIREWDDFDDTVFRLCNVFIKHGVGINYFMNESDWRWLATDLSDFKLPRKTKVGQENIDVCCYLRFYSPTDLYQMIVHPNAEELGYNVEACKKAIMNCVNNNNNFFGYAYYDWEKLEVEIKNNDMFFANGTADAQSIRVVNMLVTEYAQEGEAKGRVSHFMFNDDTQASDFLYKKIGRYESISQAITVFTFGVGTNGYYHGVRGQGYKIFAQAQALNRLWCQAMDGTMLASSIMVQTGDEDDAQDLQLAYYGPFSILPSGLNVIERPAIPNVAQNVFPVIQGVAQMMRDKTGSYNTQQFLDDSREKTKFEIQAQLSAIAKMSLSALNLFYGPWERHLREVLRRMKRRSFQATDPGGLYIVELKKRLLERGVPLEAFYDLDVNRLKVVKAVGGGSEAARLLAFDRVMTMSGALDDYGKANLFRDFLAEFFGYRNAARYIQKPDAEQRPSIEVSIAELQNDALLSGGIATVKPNDNQLVHAQVHIAVLGPLVQQVAEILAVDPIAAAQQLPGLQALNAHATDHVLRLSQDPNMKEESAQFRQVLQQADEVIHNGTLKVQKLQEQQAMQAQEQGQQAPEPQIDPKVIAQIEAKRAVTAAQIEDIQAKGQAAREQQALMARQKLAITDAESASRILRE